MKIMTPQHGCAWITGASSGIGAALAEELAGRGWTVAISARRESDLQNVAAQHEDIHCFPCDVRDRAAMAQTVSAIDLDPQRQHTTAVICDSCRPPNGACDFDRSRTRRSHV
mgnify:CR=1 FL=1